MEALNGTDLEGRLVRIEFARSSGPLHRPHLYDDDRNDAAALGAAESDPSASASGDAHGVADCGLQYGGLDPSYCMAMPHAAYAAAYIPGQYCDPHLPYQYLPSAYYQPSPSQFAYRRFHNLAPLAIVAEMIP